MCFCPYVLEGKKVTTKKANWNIIKSFNYETQNVIYMVQCKKQRCKNSDTSNIRHKDFRACVLRRQAQTTPPGF